MTVSTRPARRPAPIPCAAPHVLSFRSLLWCAAVATGAAGVAHAQSSIEVTARDGRVWIRAQGAAAADIASALAEQTGISMVVTGEPSTPLTANIEDEKLEKAIAEIAPNNMVVRASASPDSAITEIVMMMPDSESGVADSAEFLPSGEPADGVVGGEEQTYEEQAYEEQAYEEPVYDPETGLPVEQGIGEPVDPSLLRDPNRRAAVQEAANMAREAELGADGLPLPLDGQDYDPSGQAQEGGFDGSQDVGADPELSGQ